MEIQKLSKKYMVRKLNDTDIDKIYEVMQGNPQYFQYCPPMATAQSIADDMNALPPRTTYDDKYYIGYFEATKELLRHGFEDLGMTTIWCGYYDGNGKSKRVQEKVGFEYHHTCNDVPVTLLNEIRVGHTNVMTKEHWAELYK